MNKKKILFGGLLIFIVLIIITFNYYQKIYSNNVLKSGFVYIKTNSTLEDLTSQLSKFLDKPDHFYWVAEKKKFTKPKAGKYQVNEGMSNNDLVNLLRSGNQVPVKVTFNNQDYIEKLAGRISRQIEADSISIVAAFKDSKFLEENKLTKASVLEICIPNSYEFFWNTDAVGFRNRMLKEYKAFWNSNRLSKAKNLNMTPSQVMTLASIVQKETSKVDERPRVAGLYLNRLKKGWPLQADPTIIYAIREKKGQDFSIKRVLFNDLKIKSPYNTYTNKGLPPTLISMPDISSIDGVLNAEKHNYFYMCVDVDNFGYHAFAKTQTQHNRNASKYHRWLNQNGIRR